MSSRLPVTTWLEDPKQDTDSGTLVLTRIVLDPLTWWFSHTDVGKRPRMGPIRVF